MDILQGNPVRVTGHTRLVWLIRSPTPRLFCGKDDRTPRALGAAFVRAVIPGDAQATRSRTDFPMCILSNKRLKVNK
jgi:hypothetical protein